MRISTLFSGHKILARPALARFNGKSALLRGHAAVARAAGNMIKDVRFEQTVYQNAPEKFEAGTPDIAGVVGLGAAIDYLSRLAFRPSPPTNTRCWIRHAGTGDDSRPAPHRHGYQQGQRSCPSSLPACRNEAVARQLDKQGIAVRAGHHCAQPAIRHFGLESSVRPSLAFYNTREEVDALGQLPCARLNGADPLL